MSAVLSRFCDSGIHGMYSKHYIMGIDRCFGVILRALLQKRNNRFIDVQTEWNNPENILIPDFIS